MSFQTLFEDPYFVVPHLFFLFREGHTAKSWALKSRLGTQLVSVVCEDGHIRTQTYSHFSQVDDGIFNMHAFILHHNVAATTQNYKADRDIQIFTKELKVTERMVIN